MCTPAQHVLLNLPRERARAFAAFSGYLDVGPERSLAAVGVTLGKSTVQMEKWSRRYGWVARVQAHGERIAAVEREAVEAAARLKAGEWLKRKEALLEEEWRARNEFLELARVAIARWKARATCSWRMSDVLEFTPTELSADLGRFGTRRHTRFEVQKLRVATRLKDYH